MEVEPGLTEGCVWEPSGRRGKFQAVLSRNPPFPISTLPHPEKAYVKMSWQKGNQKQELRLPCLRLEYLLARISRCWHLISCIKRACLSCCLMRTIKSVINCISISVPFSPIHKKSVTWQGPYVVGLIDWSNYPRLEEKLVTRNKKSLALKQYFWVMLLHLTLAPLWRLDQISLNFSGSQITCWAGGLVPK